MQFDMVVDIPYVYVYVYARARMFIYVCVCVCACARNSITYMAPMRNFVVLGLYSTYSSKTGSPLIHFSHILIIIITNVYYWKKVT